MSTVRKIPSTQNWEIFQNYLGPKMNKTFRFREIRRELLWTVRGFLLTLTSLRKLI